MQAAHPTDPQPRPRPVVVVCGRGPLVERVRGLLVDHGVRCASALRPDALVLPEQVAVAGWIRAGLDSAWPRSQGPRRWRITVEVAPPRPARFLFCWPEEAAALAASVVELGDWVGYRSAADIVVEQRARHALRSAGRPFGGVAARVSKGVVFLEGHVAWAQLWAEADRVVARVPGVTAVVVGRAGVEAGPPGHVLVTNTKERHVR